MTSQVALNSSRVGDAPLPCWDELGTGRYYTWYLGLELELPLFMRAERARVREAEEGLREISLRKRKPSNKRWPAAPAAARCRMPMCRATWQRKGPGQAMDGRTSGSDRGPTLHISPGNSRTAVAG